MDRAKPGKFEEFYKLILHIHRIANMEVMIGYADVHGDLLPINNDDNFCKAVSTAHPLLRIFIQKQGRCFFLSVRFPAFIPAPRQHRDDLSEVSAQKINFIHSCLPLRELEALLFTWCVCVCFLSSYWLDQTPSASVLSRVRAPRGRWLWQPGRNQVSEPSQYPSIPDMTNRQKICVKERLLSDPPPPVCASVCLFKGSSMVPGVGTGPSRSG